MLQGMPFLLRPPPPQRLSSSSFAPTFARRPAAWPRLCSPRTRLPRSCLSRLVQLITWHPSRLWVVLSPLSFQRWHGLWSAGFVGATSKHLPRHGKQHAWAMEFLSALLCRQRAQWPKSMLSQQAWSHPCCTHAPNLRPLALFFLLLLLRAILPRGLLMLHLCPEHAHRSKLCFDVPCHFFRLHMCQ